MRQIDTMPTIEAEPVRHGGGKDIPDRRFTV